MTWVYESDDYPPCTAVMDVPQIKPDLSRPERVSYGMREDDPTTQATLTQHWVGPGLPFVASRYDRLVTFRLIPQRRKRFVTWRDSDGQTWGEWTWEHVEPRMEAVG